MDYTLSPKAFLKQHFDLKKLTGHEKFLAMGAALAGGTTDCVVRTQQVKKSWSKTILGIAYSHTYYHRAQMQGWVISLAAGQFVVTDQGLTYLESIATQGPLLIAGTMPGLSLFMSGKTHTFDKFLRALLSKATAEVCIADSYVDDTIFDNLLDQIPDVVSVRLLFGNAWGKFDARIKRYKIQYTKFAAKHLEELHDRFLIIGGTAYILGPSLKDAAKRSPALVVELGTSDSVKLKKFFDGLWLQAK